MQDLVSLEEIACLPNGYQDGLEDKGLQLQVLDFPSSFSSLNDSDFSFLDMESQNENADQEMFDIMDSFTSFPQVSPQEHDSIPTPDNQIFEFQTFNDFGESASSLEITPTSSIAHDNDYVYSKDGQIEENTARLVSAAAEEPRTFREWDLVTAEASKMASPGYYGSQKEECLSGGHHKGSKKTKYTNIQVSFSETIPEKLNQWLNQHFYPYIQPNGITYARFRKVPENDEYIYKRNPKAEIFLPPRYSNSSANYYEPLVVRYRKSHQERGQGDGEGLCPYCQSDDLSELFFERKDSNYLHHVTKLHGVYSNGMEMPFPRMVGEALEIKHLKTRGRTERRVHSVECEKCHETVKIQQLDCDKEGNKFLAYFRHMLLHNEKKNVGKRTSKFSLFN
ncbi:hypothetical protein KL921_002484 [Ogataea angusta]|uniref:Transcription regulator Rua1 C-terminal domain-containing protein n=1 Tax=Pichia angusta TaxID=870730 RepID=A0AAN6DGP8_PICAN|nr:uncharacterized protein KL928_001802 [Ogataea angusta]KAG7810856.1 hypothetical protein KL921_002484 [Ogataea angusta]KAG7820365.1 hypothetical protein KL928_001802 [Ogataea angusta]KAG7824049.1 hypothetical protein KL909_002786 [Ogataea angusta]KAG7829739.1 hypothetical protein KL920_002598 [Ogataea angusta]KAG7847058.1 hypothetical protein KL941_002851 [Ogataea angusta]